MDVSNLTNVRIETLNESEVNPMKNTNTGKTYGYCRISTNKQSIERQERNIKEGYPEAVIIKEAYTGTKVEGREKFEKLLKTVKPGDTIVFDSVSRMSRNAAEGIELYKELYSNGVELIFIKEPQINTETYKKEMEKELGTVATGDQDTDELVNTILNALTRYTLRLAEKQIKIAFDQAEKEVLDLRQRTKEGLVTAKLAGKQVGRNTGDKLTTKKSLRVKITIRKHSKDFDGTLNDAEVMKLIKGEEGSIARNTYYKYKREIMEGN